MFIGEFDHKLDAKNRVIVPMKLREVEAQPGVLASEFILTRGTENCIFVYTREAWAKLIKALPARALPREEHRRFQRVFHASAGTCTCDRQGRIVIPEKLRQHAGLAREVTWIGVGERAEIWDTARWREYEAVSLKLYQDTFDQIAQELDSTPPERQKPEGSP